MSLFATTVFSVVGYDMKSIKQMTSNELGEFFRITVTKD